MLLFFCLRRSLIAVQGSKIGHSGKLYFFRGIKWYSGGSKLI